MKSFISRIVLGLAICVVASAASRAETIYTIPYGFNITFNSTGIASIDFPAIANPLFSQSLGSKPITLEYNTSLTANSVKLLNSWTQGVYLDEKHTLDFPLRIAMANVPGPLAQATNFSTINFLGLDFPTGPVKIAPGATHLIGDAALNKVFTTGGDNTQLESKQYFTYLVPVYSSTNALVQPLNVALINPVGGTIEATGVLKITVIPEPSSIVLMGLGSVGTVGMLVARRRRRRG